MSDPWFCLIVESLSNRYLHIEMDFQEIRLVIGSPIATFLAVIDLRSYWAFLLSGWGAGESFCLPEKQSWEARSDQIHQRRGFWWIPSTMVIYSREQSAFLFTATLQSLWYFETYVMAYICSTEEFCDLYNWSTICCWQPDLVSQSVPAGYDWKCRHVHMVAFRIKLCVNAPINASTYPQFRAAGWYYRMSLPCELQTVTTKRLRDYHVCESA